VDAFPDDNSTSGPSVNSGGRDRAFSFECFAFGINEDEPLPPLDHPGAHHHHASNMHHSAHDISSLDPPQRPRGDSIIFDPSSFQDGGIHEQNALEKPRADAGVAPARPASSRPDDIPSSVLSTSAKATLGTKHSLGPPAIVTTTTSGSSNSNGASLSLALVNKDGRIGIYLPEARRARIARFHAKRSRRIWRKRIKYDCRKKLADSRPRIKGRFVKRSDMD
jgi:hypothetical protein